MARSRTVSAWVAPVHDGMVLVPHPKGDGYVSLRATATDSEGNSVIQAVIRAYRIE